MESFIYLASIGRVTLDGETYISPALKKALFGPYRRSYPFHFLSCCSSAFISLGSGASK